MIVRCGVDAKRRQMDAISKSEILQLSSGEHHESIRGGLRDLSFGYGLALLLRTTDR